LIGVAACMLMALAVTPSVDGARPLRTAIAYTGLESVTSDRAAAYSRVRATGASAFRLTLHWNAIAPERRPEAFDASNPNDPAYRWDEADDQVRQVVAAGLDPVLAIYDAPSWARMSGSSAPRPGEMRDFARAAAGRYSGRGALPRVRYWVSWLEPNLTPQLQPQVDGKRPVAPARYRRMTNELAESVYSVRADNVVVAGGTAPFYDDNVKSLRWGPLSFMRELLCLSRTLKRKCSSPIRFDVWAHNPYTSGSPFRHAVFPDDVSLGDLPEMRRVLQAGVRSGRVISRNGPVQFWVTEFGWDTSPPDPEGVPLGLHARWTAEALHVMWQNGVSLVTWLSLRDEPMSTSYFQSGLYFRGPKLDADRPKPALRAFRFPFVAYREGTSVIVWGRTPTSDARSVVVEQSAGRGWRRLATLRASENGIFRKKISSESSADSFRARVARDVSIPFSLRRPRERFFNPFGLPKLVEPRKG